MLLVSANVGSFLAQQSIRRALKPLPAWWGSDFFLSDLAEN